MKTRNKIICINKEKVMFLLFPACLLLLIFVLCTFSLSYKQPSQGQTSSSYQKDLIKWNWTAVYDIALLLPLNSLRFQDWSLIKCSKANSLYLTNALLDLDCCEALCRCPWGGWLLRLSLIHCLAVLLQ